MWNIESRKEIKTFFGHKFSVRRVCFSSDGKTLASCSDDKTIIIRFLETDKEIIINSHKD